MLNYRWTIARLSVLDGRARMKKWCSIHAAEQLATFAKLSSRGKYD